MGHLDSLGLAEISADWFEHVGCFPFQLSIFLVNALRRAACVLALGECSRLKEANESHKDRGDWLCGVDLPNGFLQWMAMSRPLKSAVV